MTKRKALMLALDYACGILLSAEGCNSPEEVAESEADEQKFWDALRTVGRSLNQRLGRMERADKKKAVLAHGGRP